MPAFLFDPNMINAARVIDQPIIHPGSDKGIGTNINGPSVIAVPSWVANPLGRFYLYFAHHQGKHIRMAYADRIEGPWQIYTPGVLNLEDSLFESTDIPSWSKELMGTDLYAHIASPDVHIDHENQRIRMYYHGMLADADQQTRVAYSQDGLHFIPNPLLLGAPYFRAFKHNKWVYVFSWGGQLLRAETWDGPFQQGPILKGIATDTQPNRIFRHCAILVRDNVAHVFFSCIGDCPEQILHTKINLQENWENWSASSARRILKPELLWEGAQLPKIASKVGAAHEPCHELRDPCIFEYGQTVYLLYCGAGESGGIGVAKLTDIE